MTSDSDPPGPCSREDLVLIARALEADRAAIAELAGRLRCVPQILRACNAKHGRPLQEQELDDLVQDVLLVVWKKMRAFHGLAALEAWIYRICVLEFFSALRRVARSSRPTSLTDPEGGTREPAPGKAPDPWEFDDVHQGLRRIGSVEAQVIRLKHFEGLTFEEIGERLDVSPNTAKARYYRGIRELAPLLEERRPPES